MFFLGTNFLPMITTNVLADITTGLVGYWNFDEGSGNIVYDSSGNGNDGTIFGASWTIGVLNNALDFDGVDDYVLVPDSDILNVSKEITIAAWIKADSTNGPHGIVAKWNDNTEVSEWSYYFKEHNDNDKLRFHLSKSWHSDLVDLTGTTSIPTDGTWIHAAATYDSDIGVANIYFDGVKDASCNVTVGQLIDSSKTDLMIGAIYDWTGPIHESFNGSIDEVRIYSRALSESDIQELYNQGVNQPPNKPTINGEVNGKPNTEYEYTFVSTDSDGDNITYCINWGDNTSKVCIGPYQSGVEVSSKHIWSEKGDYTITVKARDIFGAESDPATFEVSMPKYKVINIFLAEFLPKLFQRFQNVFPLISNKQIEPEGRVIFTAVSTGPCLLGWNDNPTNNSSPFDGYIESGNGFVINFGTMPYHNINGQLTNYNPGDNNEEVLWKVKGKTLVSINWQHGEVNHHLQIFCKPQETTCGGFVINNTSYGYVFACPRGPGGVKLEDLTSEMLAFNGYHRNGSKTESISGFALFAAMGGENLTPGSPPPVIGMWLVGANNNGEVEFFHVVGWAKNEGDWMGVILPKAKTFYVNFWKI